MIFASSLCYNLVGLSFLPICVCLPLGFASLLCAPFCTCLLLLGFCSSSHWLWKPLLRVSLSLAHPSYTTPLLSSWATASGCLLSLFFFPLGLADSSGLGGLILVFGGPVPPLLFATLRQLIMRWYLWPLASAFLYSHPPYLVSISSLLCVFYLLCLLILFPPLFPFPSFRRWR